MAEFQVTATEKYIRASVRKVRLVVDLVRGRPVEEALNLLAVNSKGAAKPVSKAIASAAANAVQNFGMNREDLYVATILADKGPSRRWRKIGGRSRIKPIEHRTTHLTVGVAERTPGR